MTEPDFLIEDQKPKVYDQHLRDLGIPTDLPDGMDTPAYIIEPDDP
jgi:hypothetical protein